LRDRNSTNGNNIIIVFWRLPVGCARQLVYFYPRADGDVYFLPKEEETFSKCEVYF